MLHTNEQLENRLNYHDKKCLLVLRKQLKMWQANSGWQAINGPLLSQGIFFRKPVHCLKAVPTLEAAAVYSHIRHL